MELQQQFQKSGQEKAYQDEVKNLFNQSAAASKVEEYVEKMILADLESNPGLMNALGHDGTMDPAKTMKVFGSRISREVEHGMAGQPIDEFFKANEPELLSIAKTKLRRI